MSAYYPHMFCFSQARPVCCKHGCTNESQYYTWMQFGKGGSLSLYHTLVCVCNVHVKEYSDIIVEDIENLEKKFQSKRKGGESDG